MTCGTTCCLSWYSGRTTRTFPQQPGWTALVAGAAASTRFDHFPLHPDRPAAGLLERLQRPAEGVRRAGRIPARRAEHVGRRPAVLPVQRRRLVLGGGHGDLR